MLRMWQYPTQMRDPSWLMCHSITTTSPDWNKARQYKSDLTKWVQCCLQKSKVQYLQLNSFVECFSLFWGGFFWCKFNFRTIWTESNGTAIWKTFYRHLNLEKCLSALWALKGIEFVSLKMNPFLTSQFLFENWCGSKAAWGIQISLILERLLLGKSRPSQQFSVLIGKVNPYSIKLLWIFISCENSYPV